MLVSDLIERIILDMLNEGGGIIEFKRNDLAVVQGCVPSQINYVLSSRFTKEKGYIVESKRGGGGYIKITQVKFDKPSYIMHFINAVGERIDYETTKIFLINLYNQGVITEREMKIILNVTSDNVLRDSMSDKNIIRASILKQAVLSVVN